MTITLAKRPALIWICVSFTAFANGCSSKQVSGMSPTSTALESEEASPLPRKRQVSGNRKAVRQAEDEANERAWWSKEINYKTTLTQPNINQRITVNSIHSKQMGG